MSRSEDVFFVYSMHVPVTGMVDAKKIEGDASYLVFVLSDDTAGVTAKEIKDRINDLSDKTKFAWGGFRRESSGRLSEEEMNKKWKEKPEAKFGEEVRQLLYRNVRKMRDCKGPPDQSLVYYAFTEKELESRGLRVIRERDPPPQNILKQILGIK